MSTPPYPPQDSFGRPQDSHGRYGQQDPRYGAYGQPYGQPYGFGAMPMEHPNGTTILVLGILSIVLCQILGPVAWSMGSSALAEIDRNPAAYTNRGMIQAGRVCGIVGTVFLIITVLYIFAFVGLVAGMSS